jgi:membrane protein implicated in regulation of membrane protease activity
LEAAVQRRIPRKLAIRAMSASDLELVFTSSALLGTAFLILSGLGAGLRVRFHVPVHLFRVRLPFLRPMRDDATAMPILLGFVAMFGIGGLVGAALQQDASGQLLTAVGFGIAGASLAFGIFLALGRAEGRRPTSLRDLIGRRAIVTISIGAHSRGTVRLTYDGAIQILPATADASIARGREVEIVAVHGMAVTVRSLPPP